MKRATKRIKPLSQKRSRQNTTYLKLRQEFLLAHPTCYCFGLRPGCTAQSTEIHHAAKREGKWLTDVRGFRAACRACHDWAERNGNDAKAIGMTLTREQIRKLNEQES